MTLLLLFGVAVIAVSVGASVRLCRPAGGRSWADTARALRSDPRVSWVGGAEPILEVSSGTASVRVAPHADQVVAELRGASFPHAFAVGPADPDSLDPGIGDAAFDAVVAIHGHQRHALRWLDEGTRTRIVRAVEAGLEFTGRSWRCTWSTAPTVAEVHVAICELTEAATVFTSARHASDLLHLAEHDPCPGVRRSAWLAVLDDPRLSLQEVAAAVEHVDPGVRRAACRRLVTTAHSLPNLEALLLRSELAETEVVVALGNVGTLRCIPRLQAVARRRPATPTTRAARAALRQLGKRFPVGGAVSLPSDPGHAAAGALTLSESAGSLSDPPHQP